MAGTKGGSKHGQGGRKVRSVDDAQRGGPNEAAHTHETIVREGTM